MKTEQSSGNVFADLGLANADKLLRLAAECRAQPNGHIRFHDEAKALREGKSKL